MSERETFATIKEKAKEESHRFVKWFIRQPITKKKTNVEWIEEFGEARKK